MADVNAFATLGVSISDKFELEIWLDYCDFCRKTVATARVDLRTLDRALWGYTDAKTKGRV